MGILTRLQAWALTALAVLLVLFGAYALGGRAAKKSADQKKKYDDALRAAAGAKGVHDAEAEVRAMPTGGAADKLRSDWMRDDEPGGGT
jgi:hypothetical protein